MPHPCRSRHSLFRSLAIPLVVIAFATLGRAILRSARVDAAGPSAASLTLDQTSAPDWTTAQRSPEAPTSPSDTGPPDTEPFYEVNTHRAISNVALRRPDCVVDTYLKNELLLTNGIFTSTSGGILATRLEEGAEHEDTETISRPRNHFYNPVTNGGLNDIFSGTSSLQWAYDNAGNQFDWRGARDAYYRSLTRPTQTERLNELANTFFALGHVIHLVEDLGQPQHTRNDAHITYFPGAPYEDYCHTNYGTAAAVGGLATAPLPSFTVMASPFSGIPDEFAAFWDTGQYTGQTAFAGFAATPGLAEFSNAYFLTDDTMFGTVRTVALRRPGTTPLVLRLTEALDNNSTAAKHRFAHPSIRNTNLASFYPTETRITLQREGEDETNPLHYV
ncbi:MAG: hypothetical protein KC729_19345, partial [Candidatus Eisenbacteria bacterium]|nr:hypothetical protein [Candidatus Eisenbacteria bacterium]